MTRKFITAAIPAVAAGQTLARTEISTTDDASPRTVRIIRSSLTTKGMTLQTDISGVQQFICDAAALNALAYDPQVSYVVPVNVKISFSLVNTTGGALVAGDFIVIGYDV